MTTINDAYINALLADACYVDDLIPEMTGLALAGKIGGSMTPALATYIGNNFTVIQQVGGLSSSFDATVWRGNAGTPYAGQVYVSMRGTQEGPDFVADGDLASSGLAHRQLVDMVNWWLRETTPARFDDGTPRFATQITLTADNDFASGGLVLGTGNLAGIGAIQSVSLGGYLASAFVRLFGTQWPVTAINTFNSAGFTKQAAANIENGFSQIAQLIGPASGLGNFSNPQNNYYGANGINVTTNTWDPVGFQQYGTRIGLFQEDSGGLSNHSMYKLTDLLALGNALERLDSTLDLTKLSTLVSAGSNQMVASYEGVLDGARRLMSGPNVPPTLPSDASGTNTGQPQTRIDFQANLKALTDSGAFISLVGKITIASVASSLASQAKARVGFEEIVALRTLSPFVVSAVGADGTAALAALWQSAAWGTEYQAWIADKASLQAGGEASGFTNSWIDDRSMLLKDVLQINTADVTSGIVTDATLPTDRAVELRYFEQGSQQSKTLTAHNPTFNIAGNTSARQLISFGSDIGEALNGTTSRFGDHLYGGGGNDIIDGLAGDDYLEGNADADALKGGKDNDTLIGGTGDDSLDGGAGIDLLKGGDGNDTYTVDARDGAGQMDTIIDSDGVGQVNIVNGSGTTLTLNGGTKEGTSGNRWVSSDKQFVYTLLDQGDGSSTLTIVGAGTQVQVRNWSTSKNLGINLSDAPAQTDPATTALIEGDRDPQTGALMPGRADSLTGTVGDDLIKSYGGDDQINYSSSLGGNDWIQAGTGNDFAIGGAGADLIEGGAGRDAILGQQGNDEIWGGDRSSFDAVNDQTTAGADSEADLVTASSGDDTVYGGASNDLLLAGSGKDVVVGGAGDDNILGDRAAGNIPLAWQVQRVVTTDANGNITSRLLDLGQIITAVGADPQADVIFAGTGNDWVLADAGDDYVDAATGDDVIWGGAGADFITGGEGNDWLHGDGSYANTATLDYTLLAQHGNDVIYGGAGTDSIFGGGGDDYVDGGADNDQLIADGGDDVLVGGTGNDVLRGDAYGLDVGLLGNDYLDGGDGDDQLVGDGKDDELFGGVGNDLLIGDDTNTTLAVTAHGDDYLDGGDGNDTLIGGGKNDTLFGGSSDDKLYGDGDTVATSAHGDDYLDGGDGNDYLQGYGGSDVLIGAVGNDTLFGQDGDDTLEGGAGFDYMIGGAGNDTYVFNAGDANTLGFQEVIDDTEGVNSLVLRGTALYGIDMLPTTNPGMFLIQSGIDEIYVSGLKGGSFGTVEVNGTSYTALEFFGQTFAWEVDETTDTPNATLQGGKNSDSLTATGGYSTLAGGAGNDSLIGSGGHNTYRYYLSDGVDTITDSSTPLDANGQPQGGTLMFGAGLNAGDIKLSSDSGALVISFSPDQANAVRIMGFNASDAAQATGVIAFGFADGNELTHAELVQRGFDITGTNADETLRGTNLADRLAGGGGSDTLIGAAGADTYTFNAGDGSDVISDGDAAAGSGDALRFGDGILPGAVVAVRSGRGGVTLVIGDGSDRVTLTDYFSGGANAVEDIEFADGTQWTQANVYEVLQGATDGNDEVVGDDGDNTLDGRGGNDIISGLGGNDLLVGGTGSDTLEGGLGNDTFVFNIGDGADSVGDAGGDDTLAFGAGIVAASITLQDSGNDLTLVIGSSGDSVKLSDYLAPVPNAGLVERIEFSDGSVWTHADVLAKRLGGTAGDDVITGFGVADQIDALGGNDVVYGRGGDDVLRGNTGADSVYGGAGNDTYDYRVGDGMDVISDADPSTGGGGIDTLLLGAGISSSSATLQRQGDDLVVNTAAASDTITIAGYYTQGDFERIAFSDGTVWTQLDIAVKAPITGTSGADAITGTAVADVIDGGSGSDTIHGGNGDDVIRGGTDPARKIAYYFDYLYGDSGNDLISSGSAPAYMYGGDGNDIITGAGRLDGGLGSNLLIGSGGNDTFVFASTAHNIFIGGNGDDGFNASPGSGPVPSPTGRNLFLYNAGDDWDGEGYIDYGNTTVIVNDVLSLGRVQYSKLGIDGGIGFSSMFLKVGRIVLGVSDYSPDYPTENLVKYLQVIVAPRDYDPASADPLENKKVVLIDYVAFAQEYYATAANNRTFDLLGGLRKHIVWSSDTDAIGGQIAYEYAVSGNLDAVTLQERNAILADPGLNLVGQPIAGITTSAIAQAPQAALDTMISLVGVQTLESV